MKVGLIYFSQTGNTRQVAEAICKGIRETGVQCAEFRFEDVSKDILQTFDLIGIGCPVFYYKEPLHVRSWLQSLPDLEGQHWFVFCTHGNIIGNTLPSMAELISNKKGIVIGFFHSFAPEYFDRCRQELEKEAEKGEVRWLVDPDDVDPGEAFILKRAREMSSGNEII